MGTRDVPPVRWILESGPDGRVFDALLLAGPVLVVLIVVLGRSVFSFGIAVLYIVTFVMHVLQRFARTSTRGR